MAPDPEVLALARDTTAVICCYNGARYLRDLLVSLRNQTAPPAAVLLVDNASTDGSADLVRRDFPEVEVVTLTKNEGPCPARNFGLGHARTRLVFLVDCDVVLDADTLEKLLPALADPGVAVAEPRAVAEENPSLVQYDGAFFHYTGLLVLRNFYVPLDRAQGAGTVDVDAVVSVALLADRVRVLDAGGFDPAFFILFEDNDLSYRLRSAGSRLVCVEESRIVHRGGTAGTSFRAGLYPSRRVFLHARNRWLFIIKNYQASTIGIGLPGLLLYEGVAILFACAQLAPHAYIHGKCSFFYHLPGALAARRRTAARRTVRDRAFVRGGPLTLWPPLTAGRFASACASVLDAALRFWWSATGGLR